MKSLNVIQKFFKVIEILTLIAFICTMVAGLSSALFIIILPLLDDGSKLFVENFFDMAFGEILISGALTGIIAISLAVLAKISNTYCRNELKAGTPFTYQGSSEILRLGIISIALPVAVEIIVAICLTIFEEYFFYDINLGYYADFDIGVGIMLILASFIFRYGADILNKEKAQSRIIDHKE